MTTLYKPVLIETAEQAEALPVGTVATHPEFFPMEAFQADEGTMWTGFDRDIVEPEDMVGWTALVPIEAEEGTDTIQTGAEHSYTRTRYVTPWESV